MEKRCNLNRKGYFFLIDSILALSVLAVGAFLVFTYYAQQKSSFSTDILSEDMMSLFSDNKMSDINSLEIGLGGTYWSEAAVKNCNGNLPVTPNPESTLLQQVAIFYEKSKPPGGNSCYVDVIARGFAGKLEQNNLPKQYNFEFIMGGQRIYPSADQSASKAAAKELIPSKRIVYGVLDQETGSVFGPYNAEVLVWR